MEFKYHFNKSCSMSVARNCGNNEYYISINRGQHALPLSFYIDPNRLMKIMEEVHRMSGGMSTRNKDGDEEVDKVYFEICLKSGDCKILANQMFKFLKRIMH